MIITVYVNLSSSHDGGLDTLTAVVVDAVVVGHLRQLQGGVHLPPHAVAVQLLLLLTNRSTTSQSKNNLNNNPDEFNLTRQYKSFQLLKSKQEGSLWSQARIVF